MENVLTSAYFNLLMKIIRFLCILESSFFRLITLNPHEKQVHSYSYGSNVFGYNDHNASHNFEQSHLLTAFIIY